MGLLRCERYFSRKIIKTSGGAAEIQTPALRFREFALAHLVPSSRTQKLKRRPRRGPAIVGHCIKLRDLRGVQSADKELWFQALPRGKQRWRWGRGDATEQRTQLFFFFSNTQSVPTNYLSKKNDSGQGILFQNKFTKKNTLAQKSDEFQHLNFIWITKCKLILKISNKLQRASSI